MKINSKTIKAFSNSVNKAKVKHGHAVENGIRAMALFVQAESQKLCPVDTTNLRTSASTRVSPEEGGGFATEARVVYTASYAIYVHEIVENYHKPPTSAKFLERVLKERQKEINQVGRAVYKKSI